MEVAGRGAAVADEVERHPVAAALLQGEGAAGRHRDHRPQVADHADVADAGRGLEVAVVERALDAVREAVPRAEELAGQPVEQLGRLRPPAVGLAEAEAGEGARRVQVDRQDGPQVAVQRAQRVARLERQAGRHGGRLVPHLAVPLGHPAGEQQVLEPRVELAGEPHEGVAQQARVGHRTGSLRSTRGGGQEGRHAPAHHRLAGAGRPRPLAGGGRRA